MDRIAELESQLARAEKDAEQLYRECSGLAKERDEALARLADARVVSDRWAADAQKNAAYAEGLEADAKRWRWLRKMHEDGDGQWFVYGAKAPELGALDREVDKQIAAEGEDRNA